VKHYWTVTPEWTGEVAYLLGCGPSLNCEDVNRLHGRRVIAINDSYLLAPWAEVLYWCDEKWWLQHRERVANTFRGRIIATLENQIEGVRALRNAGQLGLETDPGAIRNGSNSGYQAINLAVHLGVKRIVLLGYDMQVKGDRLHWQPRADMQNAVGFQRTLQTTMLPKFDSLKEPLRKAGVEVVNCTVGSALKVWPYRPLGQVLQEEEVLV
jgi:hypothetical protein